MSAPLVWVTGAGGLIGSHLVRSAPAFAPGWRVAALARERLELTDFDAVARAFAAGRPSAIIHCASLSRLAACGADPALAQTVNVSVTRHLCGLAEAIPFLFLSTDLVFDGRKGNYSESDSVNPLSIYAETKAEAEQHVLANPHHTVVRLSLNTGASPGGGTTFTEVMRSAWTRGETLKLFTDEYRNPIPVQVTSRAIWELLRQTRPGLYHLAGAERLSRWELGCLLATRWPHVTARIEPSSLKHYRGPARSPDTSLNCEKLQALLTFRLPRLGEWLRDNPDVPT